MEQALAQCNIIATRQHSRFGRASVQITNNMVSDAVRTLTGEQSGIKLLVSMLWLPQTAY